MLPKTLPLRSAKYRKWVASQGCFIASVLGRRSGDDRTASCSGPIHACHTGGHGAGTKSPDTSCVNLCAYHHDRLDKVDGPERFQEFYGVNLAQQAALLVAAYQASHGPIVASEPSARRQPKVGPGEYHYAVRRAWEALGRRSWRGFALWAGKADKLRPEGEGNPLGRLSFIGRVMSGSGPRKAA